MPETVEAKIARLQARLEAHLEDTSASHAALAVRVEKLETKAQSDAVSTGEFKLNLIREERDRLAESNRHWFRYVVAMAGTVLILVAGALLGILIKR